MDMNTAIRELEKALTASPEFQNLARAKNVVDKNAKTASLLSAFNKKQESLQTSGNLSSSQVQTLLDDIHSDYERLSTVPELKNYFSAMEVFSRLFSQVCGRLQEPLQRL